MEFSKETQKTFLKCQREELSDHIIYSRIARREKNPKNKAILTSIANDELDHAKVWQKYSGQEASPNRFHVFWYTLISYILGYTFVIKLLEKGEYLGGKFYESIDADIPELKGIIDEEQAHEAKLTAMLDEERLQYVGAMVLGLNDALVELTGTIAGLTFALANTRVIALSGIITGIAATLSMAASNYLAEKADGNKNALKSSLYTGVAYLITVVFLVLPYLLFPTDMYLGALITMLLTVILIIFFFTYYISVAKSEPFWPRFGSMATISLGVAAISFVIGLLAKQLLGLDV